MEREAQVLRSAWINSNEFVHSTPKDFGENSIICLACHKGNTPETIQAAKLGKEKRPQLLSLHGLKNLRSLSSEITLFVIHLMQVWITLRETSIMQEKNTVRAARSC